MQIFKCNFRIKLYIITNLYTKFQKFSFLLIWPKHSAKYIWREEGVLKQFSESNDPFRLLPRLQQFGFDFGTQVPTLKANYANAPRRRRRSRKSLFLAKSPWARARERIGGERRSLTCPRYNGLTAAIYSRVIVSSL